MDLQAARSEYERLCGWRERWLKLANDKERMRRMGGLQRQMEYVCERSQRANIKIGILLREYYWVAAEKQRGEENERAMNKTMNQWFTELPEGRQAVLREDKWMLANNAFEAGVAAKADDVKEFLLDAQLFLESLPRDLGRGSLNGMLVQLQHKLQLQLGPQDNNQPRHVRENQEET